MRLIPCIEMLYKAEHPDFTDRFRAARADGFDAVDMHLWRDKPMDAMATAVAETGVQVFSFCADPRASLVNPAEHATVLGAVRDAVPVAWRLNGAERRPHDPGLGLHGLALARTRRHARQCRDRAARGLPHRR